MIYYYNSAFQQLYCSSNPFSFAEWKEVTVVTNQDRQAYKINVHEHVYWKAGSLWAPDKKWM